MTVVETRPHAASAGLESPNLVASTSPNAVITKEQHHAQSDFLDKLSLKASVLTAFAACPGVAQGVVRWIMSKLEIIEDPATPRIQQDQSVGAHYSSVGNTVNSL